MKGSDLERYERAVGELLVEALDKGGEPLLERVEASLGVALRHMGRVRGGVLELTPAVEAEIEASLDRARATLTLADA